MINYIEKGAGLHELLRRTGHWLREENGVWISSDDAAVQGMLDAYDPLPAIKAAKIVAIKADGLARMQTVFPSIASLDDVAFQAEFWLSIALAARVPTAPFKRIIDIYSAAKTAIVIVNGAVTPTAVTAVTPAWPA